MVFADLIRIKCGRVIQDAFALAVQVLKLAVLNSPAEHGQDHQHKAGGQRDQEVQAFHAGRSSRALSAGWCELVQVQRPARSALPTTTSELIAMPKPAAHGGSHPTSASGMHSAL